MENSTQEIGEVVNTKYLSRKDVGAKAFAGTIGTGLFIKMCGLVQGIMLARILGPTGRGQFAAVILWPTFFAGLGLMGINVAIARQAAKKNAQKELVQTAIFLSLITALITIVICYMLLPYLIPESQHGLLTLITMFLLFIPFNHIALNLEGIFQGAGMFRRLNLTRALINIVMVAGLVLMWWMDSKQLLFPVLTLLFANILVTLTRLILVAGDCNCKWLIRIPLEIIREGFPFWMARITNVFCDHAVNILLLWLLDPFAMGIYMVAVASSDTLKNITNSAGMVTFTVSAQSSRKECYDKITKVFRATTLMCFLLGSALGVAIPFLLPLIYGAKFAPAIIPAIVLIAGTFFAGQANLLDQSLRGQGHPIPGIIARLLALAILVTFALTAMRAWGLAGIVGAFVIAQVVYLWIMLTYVRRYYDEANYAKLIPRMADLIYIWQKCCSYICLQYTQLFSSI